MSKIIDTVNEAQREAEKEKTSYELTQQQLAEIYFAGAKPASHDQPPPPTPSAPLIIKVVEKPRLAPVLPWIIASIAFLIAALTLFSTKRVFVDVKLVDEAALKETLPVMKRPEKSAATVSPVEALKPQNFIFEGAAALKSSKEGDALTLINSSVAPFARASFYFNTPADLHDARIVFYAKGERGGEKLTVAVKDRENILAYPPAKRDPFPQGLTTRWQRAEIPISQAAPPFDRYHVKSFRFDFGTKDTRNKPGDTLFIKDLRIARGPSEVTQSTAEGIS